MFKKVLFLFLFSLISFPILAQNSDYTIPIKSVTKLGSVQNPSKIELGFINKQIKDVRVIGLGEVSHYTKECYTVKHAIIKHLAKTENFDTLILEVDFGQGLKWNDYVENGKGDLDLLIATTGWFTYRTKEFYNLLKDLREHNKTAKRKVRIYGMEMTYIKDNIEWLNSFLKANYPKHTEIKETINKDRKHLAFTRHSNDEILDYWKLYFQLNEILSTNKDILTKNSSENDFANAERIVEIIRQYTTYVSQNDFSLQTELRDKFSTRNVFWALNQRENSKATIWAHNGHVRKSYRYDVLGRNLTLALGDGYFSIGFMFGKGEFGSHNDDWKFTKFSYPIADKSTINYKFSQFNDNLFFNIKENLNNKNTNFLKQSILSRADISEQLRKQSFNSSISINLSETYDAIIFLNETNYPTAFSNK